MRDDIIYHLCLVKERIVLAISERRYGLRLAIGRRLLRPHAEEIIRHYSQMADNHHHSGDHKREDNCTYIAIGASYVVNGWSGP